MLCLHSDLFRDAVAATNEFSLLSPPLYALVQILLTTDEAVRESLRAEATIGHCTQLLESFTNVNGHALSTSIALDLLRSVRESVLVRNGSDNNAEIDNQASGGGRTRLRHFLHGVERGC